MPLIRKDPPGGAGAPRPGASAQLASRSSEERWAAVRALPREAQSIAPLRQALGVETDARVREAILTNLALINTEEAVAVILPLLRSDDAALRTGALDALNAMPVPVEAYVPKLLADPDADVRLLVCDTVRRLPGAVANRHLCVLLDRETVPNVAAAAIEALSEVGDDSALSVLARAAERFAGEPFLVFSIKIAIKRLGGDEAGRVAQTP